ncbi:hypothetical protein ACFVHQ_13430 [Actinomycetes bacterium NPDC127524]
MSNAPSLTEILYTVASGQEKARLTDTIQQRKQGRWALSILSTGELSIFDRTNHNVGLTVRTFEFSNVTWTKSAANADTIRNVIQNNYGHAGETFVQYLFSHGLDIMDETWKEWQVRCSSILPDTPFRTRIAKKYAVILAAADLANRSLDLGLSLTDILAFLAQQEEVISEQRDIGQRAWNRVIQLIIKHHANFRREGVCSNPNQCWGKIFQQENYMEVAFLKHVLEEQLKVQGFEDPKVVLREWKEKNWLFAESDRPTKRTRIFEKGEQEERQKALGLENNAPKKLEDTTYNLKIPKEQFDGLIRTVRLENKSFLNEENL